jgi:Replication factor RFC1 C terminal domain
MDEYYLSKEDWDTVVELGVDENKDDLVLKKISTATKTALTKKYACLILISARSSDSKLFLKIQRDRPSDTLPQSPRLG